MKKKETEKSADRHIRITDISLLEQIDEIMQYPEYNNFNKVICSALFYGLPALRKELSGEVELPPATKELEVFTQEGAPRELCKLLIQLLKEVNLNATINKSMLSSIFNACANGFGKSFAEGCYACTPDYLEDFELEGLKSLGK